MKISIFNQIKVVLKLGSGVCSFVANLKSNSMYSSSDI